MLLSLSFSSYNSKASSRIKCLVNSRQIWLVILFYILVPPKIIDITIESTNNNGILVENEQVILKCLARGTPQPKIQWNISGKNVSFNRNFIQFENKLLIRNFTRLTPKNYQCTADNGIPPRDTRTRYLIPASKFYKKKYNKKNEERCHLIMNE